MAGTGMSALRELSGWQRTLIIEDVLEGPTATSTLTEPLPYVPLLQARAHGTLLHLLIELLMRPSSEAERVHAVWRLAQNYAFVPHARRLAEILQLPEPQWPGRRLA